MSELLKCKPAWLLSVVFVLLVFSGAVYIGMVDNANAFVALGLLALTFPWSMLLMILAVKAGFGPDNMETQGVDAIFVVVLAISGLINAVILFILVFLVTKAVKYLSSK